MFFMSPPFIPYVLCFACAFAAPTTTADEFCIDSQECDSSVSLLQTSLELSAHVPAGSKSHKVQHKGTAEGTHEKEMHRGEPHIANLMEAHGHRHSARKVSSHSKSFVQDFFTTIILVLLAGAILYGLFTDHAELDKSLSHILKANCDLQEKTSNIYRRFFFIEHNYYFAEISERAFRGAVVFVLYALPFYVPAGTFPLFDGVIANGVYSSFIGQQILFNYRPTFGKTLSTAAQLLAGTCIAVFVTFMMFGFFPQGVAADQNGEIYRAGITTGVCLVLFMLWMNFPVRVTIFCLVRFASYWMDFLDPENAGAGYSVGFVMRFDGTAMKAITGSLVGSLLALMANLLPFHELSLVKAECECFHALGRIKEGWMDFTEFMHARKKSGYMMHKMQRELFTVKTHIDKCQEHLQAAWWECFGLGRRQHTRARVTTLIKIVTTMYVQLLGAIQCCGADEEWGKLHDDFMARIDTTTLIEATSRLMYLVCQHVREPMGGLERPSEATQDAILGLSKQVQQAKRDLAISPIDVSLAGPHAFARSICGFGRLSCEAAKLLDQEIEDDTVMITDYNGPDFFSVFDMKKITSFRHMEVAARLSATFFLTFIVGYVGYGDIIIAKNALLTTTFAMLISRGSGLQLNKNLVRLQGVVLGTAVGLMIHAFVATCDLMSSIGAMATLFVWVWLNLIGHFSDKEFSYLCFLLALFGQSEMVVPCSDAGYDPARADFHTIYAVIASIAIMILVDMLSPAPTASQKAQECLDRSWSTITKAFTDVLTHEADTRVHPHTKQIHDLIFEADKHGKEAEQEPRFWKMPWREQSFHRCIATLRLLRTTLYTIEGCMVPVDYTIARKEGFGFKRRVSQQDTRLDLALADAITPRTQENSIFSELVEMDSMKKILEIVQSFMKSQEALMKIFVHDTSHDAKELEYFHDKEVKFEEDLHEAVLAFARLANTKYKPSGQEISLESETTARLSTILAGFESMAIAMSRFQSALILNG